MTRIDSSSWPVLPVDEKIQTLRPHQGKSTAVAVSRSTYLSEPTPFFQFPHQILSVRQMLADASSFVCSAAKADSLVRGVAKPWRLGLLGVGIGIGIELGWLDNRSDTHADTDSDDQALSV